MKSGKWINKTAFLNGFIKEELYMMQPEGFINLKGANKICKLQRSIYVTYPICTPTLAVSGFKLFYFLGFGFLSPCVVLIFMHLISCHHVHCICIRVHLMHSSIFPVVRFAFRRFVLLGWSFLPFFRVWGLNISGLDRDLPSGLRLLPVDRLSSFVSFGLRLILQRLTEGP